MTRRRRALLVPALAIAGLAAAAPAAPAAITVGLNMPSPGFQVGSVRGADVYYAKGLEIDLARALAKRLGQTATFYQEAKFTRLVAAGRKPWDMALAQVTITKPRARNVDFSIPYLRVDQGVLRRKGLDARTRSLGDLQDLQICLQKGTTSVATVQQRIRPTRRPLYFTSTTVMLERLRTGPCDVVVADLPVLATLRAQAPQRFGTLAGRIVTNEAYGAVFADGNRLRLRVNRALKAMQAAGELQTITRRWLNLNVRTVPILT